MAKQRRDHLTLILLWTIICPVISTYTCESIGDVMVTT